MKKKNRRQTLNGQKLAKLLLKKSKRKNKINLAEKSVNSYLSRDFIPIDPGFES